MVFLGSEALEGFWLQGSFRGSGFMRFRAEGLGI